MHLPQLDADAIEALCGDAEQDRVLDARSAVALPLLARGRALGVVTLVSGTPGRYGPGDLAVAEELAHRIALAIDNARLYREAQEAVKQRDEFLSVASHELRTPINALQLAVQGLRAGTIPASPDRLPRLLELAERQTRRMTRLIDEMLSVARVEGGRLDLQVQPVDLVTVVRDVLAGLAQDLSGAGCSLEIHAPAPVIGRWDRVKLEQVAANLLGNAIKFSAGKPVEVAVEERGPTAALVIRDHGIGIAPDRLPHIFGRFERGVSAREYGGLGLGLYIVRAIVEAHGGAVSVESSPDQGSTFTVTLPCAGPEP